MSKKDKSMWVKLIANPEAGKVSDAPENLKRATSYLKENGFKVDVALARKAKATSIARQAVKKGYKIVVAMGGDGTLEAVMRGMLGSKASLGIIMAGTENNIARRLGIPADLEEACASIASDNTCKLDMGQVTNRKGKKIAFFEMAAIGLSTAIYADAKKITNGKSANIRDAIANLAHPNPKPKVSLTLNDESKIAVETMAVVVSNTPAFGKNLRLAPDASLEDGLLDVSIYPDFSKNELLNYYAAVTGEGYSGGGKVQHYQVRKLKVKTSPRLDVMADGMAFGKGTVTIKVRPGALRVITTMKSPNLESPQKGDAELLPESDSATVKENHRAERLASSG